MFTREQLNTMLNNGIVEVTFTKQTTGELRTMRCTLVESIIPTNQRPIAATPSANQDLIPVFDVDENGWKSFYVDSVKTAKAA